MVLSQDCITVLTGTSGTVLRPRRASPFRKLPGGETTARIHHTGHHHVLKGERRKARLLYLLSGAPPPPHVIWPSHFPTCSCGGVYHWFSYIHPWLLPPPWSSGRLHHGPCSQHHIAGGEIFPVSLSVPLIGHQKAIFRCLQPFCRIDQLAFGPWLIEMIVESA